MSGQRSARRAWLGRLLLALSLLWPLDVAADQLVWHAPAECPGRVEVQAELARLVARTPRVAEASTPEVVIRRVSPSVLQAHVSVRARDVVREHVLNDASCEALTRAAVLIVALAIDQRAQEHKTTTAVIAAGPAASTERDTTRLQAVNARKLTTDSTGIAPAVAPPASQLGAAAAPKQEVMRFEVALRPQASERPVLFARESRVRPGDWADAPSARDRAEPRSPTTEALNARRLGVFVGAALGVSSGMMPRLASTFGVHAGMTWDRWRAALRLGFAPAQTARLAAASGAGGSVALALAALEGGLLFRGFGLEFPVLAGVESGMFLARALGAAEQGTRVSDWIAGYLSPGVSHTWRERLRFFLRLDGLVALRRPRFALEGPDASVYVFHQPERLAARIYLGLDVILW